MISDGRAGVINVKESESFYDQAAQNIEKITALAEAGDPFAQVTLSFMYDSGKGVEKNKRAAIKWSKLAAEQGHPQGMYHLASRYLFDDDFGEKAKQSALKAGIEWANKAASTGLPWAHAILGTVYEFGIGVQANFEKAADHYARAHLKGSTLATVALGDLYARGQGVETDLDRAASLYREAAEAGHSGAQFRLGRAYIDGEGVESDPEKAIKWLKSAIEAGHVRAMVWLGFVYEIGLSNAPNLREAEHWYQKAAEQGDVVGQTTLGEFYATGNEEEIDIDKAKEWFEKAIDQGHKPASKNYRSLRWKWFSDANFDGSVTISDVGAWAGWVFHAPGDFIVDLIIDNVEPVGDFFEFDHQSHGRWLSVLISISSWIFVFGVLAVLSDWSAREAPG